MIASIPVSTSYLSSPTHHRLGAAASTGLAGKTLVWSDWRLACQQENHKPCLLHQHGLFFRASVPLMILIKGYGTGRSWNYQNRAVWKTGRVVDFFFSSLFSITENNAFLVTKKNWHFWHCGTEVWDRSPGTPGQGGRCRDPRSTCVFRNDTSWAVSPLRGTEVTPSRTFYYFTAPTVLECRAASTSIFRIPSST